MGFKKASSRKFKVLGLLKLQLQKPFLLTKKIAGPREDVFFLPEPAIFIWFYALLSTTVISYTFETNIRNSINYLNSVKTF